MKRRKIILSSFGFLCVGVLVLLGTVPMLLRSISRDESMHSAYPALVSVLASGAGFLCGLYWLYRGVGGVLVFFSAVEEEREKWLEDFEDNEHRLRGGGRREVIFLGVVAIVLWLVVGLYFYYGAD